MLNLEELEKKINEALEKETSESLTNWLMSKRNSDIEIYIGEGDYVPCKVNEYIEEANFELETIPVIIEIDYCSQTNTDSISTFDFEMAA